MLEEQSTAIRADGPELPPAATVVDILGHIAGRALGLAARKAIELARSARALCLGAAIVVKGVDRSTCEKHGPAIVDRPKTRAKPVAHRVLVAAEEPRNLFDRVRAVLLGPNE